MAKALYLCSVTGDNQPLVNGVRAILINSDDAGGVQAFGAITFTGVGTAGDTVTIGGVVYTLRAVPAAAGDVDIGATATETAANLVAAINAGAGSGTAYGAGTVVHPTVFASSSAGVVTVTAKDYGPAGNSIATTENGTAASFAAATLTGGTIAQVQLEAIAAANRAAGTTAFRAGYFDTVVRVDNVTGLANPVFADTAAYMFDHFDGVTFVAAA